MLHGHQDQIRQIGVELATKPGYEGHAYKVVAALVGTEPLGVPQTRRRLLIIGVKENLVDPGTYEQLGRLLFPTQSPAHLFDVDDEWQFLRLEAPLSASAILDDLAPTPPAFGKKDSPWLSGYGELTPSNRFRREMRTSKEDYLGGKRSDANWQLAYTNHEASVHTTDVIRRMRLLRHAAAEDPESRCSSARLKAKVTAGNTSLRTNKAAQRVLLSDHWPMLTVTSLPDDIVHHREDRIPTVREMARLQTFPDWFEFKGVRTTGGDRRRAGVYVPQYTQVANAVPPRFAFAVSARIRWFLQKVVGQGRRGCDFDLPGGAYAQPSNGTASAALQDLNTCFSICAAQRERSVTAGSTNRSVL